MRSGWKALLAGGVAGLAIAVVAAGCDSKQEEKAKTDSSLKPLPPPNAPGGGTADQPVKGKKTTTGGASAAGAGSQ
jgi:uncharacterized membrane protein YraQ (UPF0718 family)